MVDARHLISINPSQEGTKGGKEETPLTRTNVAHPNFRCGKAPGKISGRELQKRKRPCYGVGHNTKRALSHVAKHLLKNGVLFALRENKKRDFVKVPPNPLQSHQPLRLFSEILGFFLYMVEVIGLTFVNERAYTEIMTGHRRRRGPNKKTMSNNVLAASVAEDSIQEVFDYWIAVHKKDSRRKPALDSDRRFFIALAIAKYGIEDCKGAIEGCALSPFHMGRNKQGKKYNDITLILRSAEYIEKFLEIYDKEFEEGEPW
jgi:hypothetical protein